MPQNQIYITEQLMQSLPLLISSTFGAIISAIRKPEKNVFHRISNFICGISCAIIFTPIISQHFNLSPNLIGGIGFMIGLIGDEICDYIITNGKDPLRLSKKLASWWLKK